MSSSQDTEITLGTGKMLVLFFALAAVCAVFFAMGYKLGKSSETAVAAAATPAPAPASPSVQPAAAKPAASSTTASDLAYYRSKGSDGSNAGSSASTKTSAAPAAPASAPGDASGPPDPALAETNGYFVQVAAVSKQEDANALVDALKRRQYPAFVASSADNLFHVQVGPFADVKNAEEMRARLVNDGYNPILKK